MHSWYFGQTSTHFRSQWALPYRRSCSHSVRAMIASRPRRSVIGATGKYERPPVTGRGPLSHLVARRLWVVVAVTEAVIVD